MGLCSHNNRHRTSVNALCVVMKITDQLLLREVVSFDGVHAGAILQHTVYRVWQWDQLSTVQLAEYLLRGKTAQH
jgi:hypothetical protein